MAASSVRTYAGLIWSAQKVIARKLGGTDLRRLPISDRVVLVTVDLTLAMILQALVNAGILTDAGIQNRLDAVSGATFARLPDIVLPDNEESNIMAPDPDLGNV
jgi:hypothetical protein